MPEGQANERLDGPDGEKFPNRVYGYDLHGRIATLTEQAPGVSLTTTYAYDADDQLEWVRGPQGSEQRFIYDDFGRLAEHRRVRNDESLAMQSTKYRNYTDNGHPELIENAYGETQLCYDAFGRLIYAKYPKPANYPDDLAWTEIKTWDYVGDELRGIEQENVDPAVGRLTESVRYTFVPEGHRPLDSVTQTQSWSDGQGGSASKVHFTDVEYDILGNLLCVATGATQACDDGASPAKTEYDYDALDRVKNIRSDGDLTQFAYTVDGRLGYKLLGNDTRVDYQYHDSGLEDADGSTRLFRMAHSGAGGSISSHEYHYYAGGRVSRELRWVDGDTSDLDYDYDGIGRLTAVDEMRDGVETRRRYEYLGRYDRTRETVERDTTMVRDATYSYNAAQQLRSVRDEISDTTMRYFHDGNGNVSVRSVDGAPEQARRFYYDGMDQLTRVEQGAESSAVRLGEYAYDLVGMRHRAWQATGIDNTGPPQWRQRFSYGGRVLDEYDLNAGLGVAPNRYRWAGGNLVSTDQAGARGYVHADRLGTTTAVSDVVGASAARWHYDPWGRAEADGANDAQLGGLRHRFGGHTSDTATGLIYMRARYYDPDVGLFLTQDRVPGRMTDPRSQHRYMYGHGDPVNNLDPTGLETVFIGQHDEGVFTTGGSGDLSGYTPVARYFDPDFAGWLNAMHGHQLASHRRNMVAAQYRRDFENRNYDGMQRLQRLINPVPWILNDIVESVRELPDTLSKVPGLVERAADDVRQTFVDVYDRRQAIMDDPETAVTAFGDTISFGVTKKFRQAMGYDDVVEYGTEAYKGGQSLGKAYEYVMIAAELGGGGATLLFRGGGRLAVGGTRMVTRGAKALAGGAGKLALTAGRALARGGGAFVSGGRRALSAAAARGRNALKARGARKASKAEAATTTRKPPCMSLAAGTLVMALSGMVAIDELKIGERVWVDGPADVDEEASRESREYAVILGRFGPVGDDGDYLEFEVLRSRAWIESEGLSVGGTVEVSRLGMLTEGSALVVGIVDAPELESGAGRMVTGRFTHLSATQHVVTLEDDAGGELVELRTSPEHRLYSESRGGWVAVQALAVGEMVRARGGVRRIARNEVVEREARLFDIEVEGEHRYLVSAGAVWSHNCPDEVWPPKLREVAPDSVKGQTAASNASGNVAWKNGYRTPDGKFASPNGAGKPGEAAVDEVQDAIRKRGGYDVLGREITVRDAAGNARRYDLVVRGQKSGKVIGIEVKSGGARRNAYQRFMDNLLNRLRGLPGVGKKGRGIVVDRAMEIRRP